MKALISIGSACFCVLIGIEAFALKNYPDSVRDSAVYTVLAKTLVEKGEYRNQALIDAPVEVKYPPIFPLYLSAFWKTFPGSFAALKFAVLLTFAAAVVICLAMYAAHASSSGRSLASAALPSAFLAFNPSLLNFSTIVMSELLYTALSVAAILLFEKAMRKNSLPFTAAAAAVASMCFLTRTVGLALLTAMAARALLRPGGKGLAPLRAVVVILVFVPAAAAWSVWIASHAGAGYGAEFLYADPYAPPSHLTLAGFFSRVARNAVAHFSNHAQVFLFYIRNLNLLTPIGGTLLSALLLGITAAGFARFARGGLACRELYVLLYAAMILCWPWRDQRFLVPLVPFLVLYFCEGARAAAERAAAGAGRLQTAAGMIAAAFFTVVLLQEAAVCAAFAVQDLRERKLPPKRLEGMLAVAEFVKARIPAIDVIASDRPEHLYLLSGRACAHLWLPRAPKDMRASLSSMNAAYLALSPTSDLDRGLYERYVTPFITEYGPELSLAFKSGDSAVLRLRGNAERGMRNAE